MPAVYYDYVNGLDTNDGSTKALAKQTLQAALTAAKASTPCIVYASKASAEPISTATTLAAGDTPATRVTIISVDFAGSTPPAPADYAPGAKLTTAAGIALTLTGYAERQGLSIVAGSGATGANLIYGSSTVAADWSSGPGSTEGLGSSNGASIFSLIQSGSVPYRLSARGDASKSGSAREPKYRFGAIGQTITIGNGSVSWRNMLVLDTVTSGTAVPTTLLSFQGLRNSSFDAEGCDFTGLTGNLLTLAGSVGPQVAFRDCLVPSGVSLVKGGASATLTPGTRVSAVRCSATSGGLASLSNTVVAYEGGQNEDTGVTLAGGATDGVALRSWHYAATANATLAGPYESQPMLIANDQVGSPLTVALEGVSAAGALPTNVQVWFEVEYLSASGTSLGVVATCGLANALATPVAHAAGTGTWTGAASGSTKFRMVSTSFTPNQKGFLKITPKVVSGEFWIDPKPIVSGGTAVNRSYVAPSGAMVNETGITTQGASVNVFVPVQGRRSPR